MNSRVEYEDFEVEVRSIPGKKYEARVMKSPQKQRIGERFIPPYSIDQLAGLLSAMERGVLGSSKAGRDMVREEGGGEPMPLPGMEKLGRKLFKALLPGKVERGFRESLAIIRDRGGDRQDRGLRLRVTFDREEDFALLATLPWELVWEPEGFVNRCRITPVVRSLNVPEKPVPAFVDGPLRILLMPSNPQDLSSLRTEHEATLVAEALAKNPEIKADVQRRLTRSDLRQALRDGHHHILHFMGHGDIQDQGDEFLLYFEDENGDALPVTGSQLAEYLQDLSNLRLVVLNSCWSGALPRPRGQDPFKGVAAALIHRGGIPAVVAMQFPISDEAAIAFSKVFYRRIAAGDPVSAAATEGRLAILDLEPESFEWATPVVYLAGEDRGFEIRKPEAGKPPAPRAPRNPEPLRLTVLSFKNGYRAAVEPQDDELDLTEFFNGRYIKKASLWRQEVYPRLNEFLLRHGKERRPIVFDFPAHATLAFAAGYILEAKSGLDVTMLQRSQTGVYEWKAIAGPARLGSLWIEGPEIVLDPGNPAVALAVSVSNNSVLDDVKIYLAKSRKAGVIVPMSLPKPGLTAVEDGLHALQLAQELALRIRSRTPEQRMKPLHLFASAPNALLFFLGQLGRSFGVIQLYEHDFDARGKPGAYIPSLKLPV